MTKKVSKDRKRFSLRNAKERTGFDTGPGEDDILGDGEESAADWAARQSHPPDLKPKKRKPIPVLTPVPEPPPEEPPEEPVANIFEHPTRTANRAFRKNKRWAKEKGQDPRKTDPFTPMQVPLESGDEDFRPDLNDLTSLMIGNMVANGSSNKFAAPMAGIPEGTMSYWLSRGRSRRDEITEWLDRSNRMAEEGKSAEDISNALGDCEKVDKYVRFANRIEKCTAQKHDNLFMVVWRAAIEEEDVPAAQWLLERLFAQQYGRNVQKTSVQEQDGGQHDNGEGDATEELQRRIIELTDRRRSKSSS